MLVLNVGGYIGDSTKSEVKYAIAHGKPVRWLEPDKAWTVPAEAGGETPSAEGNPARPGFSGDMEVISRLLSERGFRLGRGRYNHGNGDVLPTVVIDRPDTPEWSGVWHVWEEAPELLGEVAGEAQAAFELAGRAISTWDETAYMFFPDK